MYRAAFNRLSSASRIGYGSMVNHLPAATYAKVCSGLKVYNMNFRTVRQVSWTNDELRYEPIIFLRMSDSAPLCAKRCLRGWTCWRTPSP